MTTPPKEKVNQLVEEEVAALSTFFLSSAITNPKMSSRSATKKSFATKSTNILAKKSKAVVDSSSESSSDEEVARKSKKGKKDAKGKSKSKSKAVVESSSSSESSEEESSNESSSEDEEPPKRSKKDAKGKSKSKSKKLKAPLIEESDDEGIPLNTVPNPNSVAGSAPPKLDPVTVVADGLFALAKQMAAANDANTKILEMLTQLLIKMEERDKRDEMLRDLHNARDEEEMDEEAEVELTHNVANLSSSTNFTKAAISPIFTKMNLGSPAKVEANGDGK